MSWSAVARVALVLVVGASISCRRGRGPAGGAAPGGAVGRAWVLGIGNGLDDDIRAIAALPDSGVVVVGDLRGAATIGDRWLGVAGGTPRRVERVSGDGFYVARLDAAGNPRWVRRVETESSEKAIALATTRDGAIWLFSRASPATVESAGHAMLEVRGAMMVWGARWSAAGEVEVVEKLEAQPQTWPPALMDLVATPDGGALVVAGAPALLLSSAAPRPDAVPKRTEGDKDKPRIHLLRYDAGGKLLWARAIKSDKHLEDARAAILADGRIALVGKGTGTLTAAPQRTVALAMNSLFRADLEGTNGDARALDALSDTVGTRHGIDSRAIPRLDVVEGDLLVQFLYENKTALHGAAGPVRLAGDRETLAFARIAPDGGVRWARNAARDERLLIPAGRELLAAGIVPTDPDNNDVALSRLDGQGVRLETTHIGGLGDDAPRALALDAAGGLFVAGVFRRRLLIEEASLDTPVGAAGDHDAFLAWFPAGRLPRASDELKRRAAAAKARRAEATKAYRAKKFADACAGFATAVGLAPDDAEVRSDWALCLQKSGERARAIEENLTAIRLSVMHRSETEYDYEGDRLRARSYFNLRSLKFDPLPNDESKASDHHPRVPGCAAALDDTAWDDLAGGSGGETITSYRRISVPGGPAPPEPHHHEDRPDVVTVSNMGKARGPSTSSPLLSVGNAADIPLSSRFESNGRCYTYDDDGDCADDPESDSGSDLAESGCDLFLADACAGLVVSVCEDEKHPKRAYFQEARLVPADAWSPGGTNRFTGR